MSTNRGTSHAGAETGLVGGGEKSPDRRSTPDRSTPVTDVGTAGSRGTDTSLERTGSSGISVHTVDTIVRRIFRKLDVADRTSAALKGVAYGLIPASEEARLN